MVYSFPADPTLCPVEAVKTLISVRHSLGLSHPYLFFASRRPFAPLSIASFRGVIAGGCAKRTSTPPPGTTRAASASTAFLRGANLADVLRAGDWTSAQTFFAHYCRVTMAALTPFILKSSFNLTHWVSIEYSFDVMLF